ncbi:MAG: hypothetical protein WBE13_20440 [Candidatus Acidiferrum sp.]
MSKSIGVFVLGVVVVLSIMLAVAVPVGYCVHATLGHEALNAWGTYLTGCASLILSCAAIVAGFLGLRDYRSKATAEKSKWLLQLYEKLFEDPKYKDVRQKLDYGDTDEIKSLIKIDQENKEFTPAQRVQFDAFTDYLNLFELIAHLKEIGQLTSEDIKATFDYYLNLLTRERNPEIRQYLENTGFENLGKLLKEEYEKQAQSCQT